MNCQDWIDHFGKPADDPNVKRLIAEAAVTKPIKLGREDITVRADIKPLGMTVIFTDESILKPDGGRVGRPILSGVMMVIQRKTGNVYTGELPYQLAKDQSQKDVRGRLGTPDQINEKYQTDGWTIDGKTVAVSYTEDLSSVTQVSVTLPKNR